MDTSILAGQMPSVGCFVCHPFSVFLEYSSILFIKEKEHLVR